MMLLLLAAVGGFLSWGFVEYGIHGFLSHRWKTVVSPLHWTHHRDPDAVFTAPLAWIPVALLGFGIVTLVFGLPLASAFTTGLVAGFARYEYVHWRIHFREPRSDRQRALRLHHLAHHYADPRAYHGVTTHRWDRLFGTLPPSWREDYASVADRPLLTGPSNLGLVYNPRLAIGRVRTAFANREARDA